MAGGFEADRADQPPRPEFATCQDGMGHPSWRGLEGCPASGRELGVCRASGRGLGKVNFASKM